MCHHYGMTDMGVMGMPIRRFWLMSDNIDRIMAEKDMRGLTVAASAQGGEAMQATRDHLIVEMGSVIVRDSTSEEAGDKEAIQTLKALSQ